MIVGTAGHIDHGKTTLVRALTGVDTDRLPEEKARGISIELGYAYLDVPEMQPGEAPGRIGFIDVPGHERLVHTMLAGATGIDFALLLVAADDGVMPQTREHLAVLALLGLERGAIVITKCDRVDAGRIEELRIEIGALLHATPLAGAPVLAVSARTGDGLQALRQCLFDAARAMPQRQGDDTVFRLAVDRAFTLEGAGTIVTGTVHAGSVAVGDELELTPAAPARRARVRSLHAQNRAVTHAHAGQRCAVALVGIPREAATRGQWLVTQGSASTTQRLDALLTLWHDEQPLRPGTPVHVHTGAADVLGTVAVLHLLDGDDSRAQPGASKDLVLEAGGSAYVQLVLKQPVGAWHGDSVVLRDNAARRTLAGGRVLDPFAPTRYRRTAQRLAELHAWSSPDAAARLAGLIEVAPYGVSLVRWTDAEGLPRNFAPLLPDQALHAADPALGAWVLGAVHRASIGRVAIEALRAFHAREPDAAGPDAGRLRRLAAPRLPVPLWRALLSALRADGAIVLHGAFVQLPEHGLRLSASDERVAQKIKVALAAGRFDGHWVLDLAKDADESPALMRTTLARLAQRGELHQVVKDLFYTQARVEQLVAIVRGLADASDGGVSVGQFRDATQLGRKRAIQLLEYFDRIGLLRRVGEVRRLRQDSALLVQEAKP